MTRTSCSWRAAKPAPMRRRTSAKNGSPKMRPVGSAIATPIESFRRVTRLRAARFGTYPSWAIARSTDCRTSILTVGLRLTTRSGAPIDDPRCSRARDASGSSNFLERRNAHERTSRKPLQGAPTKRRRPGAVAFSGIPATPWHGVPPASSPRGPTPRSGRPVR